jgi:hypothetical protein
MASINLASLTKYTDQLSQSLVRESVLMGNTLESGISIITGVKYKDALNILSGALTLQAGGCGSISATGSAALSQRDVEVCPIKVEESICLNDFEQYWMGKLMKDGSYNESAPNAFNEIFTADRIAKIQQKIEDLFWLGSTANHYSNGLTYCNGLMEILEYTSATNSVVNGAGTYSGALTVANAINVVDGMIDVIPTDIIAAEDLVLYMSYANFKTYIKALRANNYFHIADGQVAQSNFEVNHPGTNVLVKAVKGLVGSNKMILTSASNIVFATDLTNDFESFQFWYEKKDDIVYFRSKWKQGAQVYFPQYVVKY